MTLGKARWSGLPKVEVEYHATGAALAIDRAVEALELDQVTSLDELLIATATVLERRVRTNRDVWFAPNRGAWIDLYRDRTLDVDPGAWPSSSCAFDATLTPHLVDQRRRGVKYQVARKSTGELPALNSLYVTIHRVHNHRSELARRRVWLVSRIEPIQFTHG